MRFFALILVFVSVSAKSQDSSKVYVQGGYGFYEGINLGLGYNCKDEHYNSGFMIGFDNFTVKNQRTYALTLYINHAVLYDKICRNNRFRYHLSGKTILWQLTDDYYLWRVVSIVPSARCGFQLTQRMEMFFDLGPSFNFVLYNERKTFKEVGWPYHVMPDASITFNFRL